MLTPHANINEILIQAAKHGINPSIVYDQRESVDDNERLKINLEFNTKAEVHLVPNVVTDGYQKDSVAMLTVDRYGDREYVETMEDVVSLFREKYFAREFGNKNWVDLAVEYGVMQRTQKVTEVIK